MATAEVLLSGRDLKVLAPPCVNAVDRYTLSVAALEGLLSASESFLAWGLLPGPKMTLNMDLREIHIPKAPFAILLTVP